MSNNVGQSKEWLEFARKDLATAELLIANEGFPEIIAFHCQQAIEKAFKAYLAYTGRRFPKTHDIQYLCQLCSQSNPVFGNYNDDCSFVGVFYIEARYPIGIPVNVSGTDAEHALQIAKTIYALVSGLVSKSI
ncbi:HEPN domain-containing protein [Mahella australiensis]|jgi:HEPN domain-containing protein|uniref:HEPN domain protein n=1 Tax=Mahella australiensis (strain DSM 15567 / CIP 107919 / 50-1 BON) TaxID=697281 RepID=F3ZW86_MAHA5|nr:HEPN domain-containing protein [Mahella australiensis]AEE97495.1 HEPN domain protein [Mahella australiensis 50-1 BON]